MLEFKIIASGSSGNCYHLLDSGESLLIECGIPWKKIQRGLHFKTSALSGCLVTHYHGDHSKAVKDVVRAGIDVHASEETFDHFGITGHRAHKIVNLEQFSLGAWNIVPFDVVHDCPGTYGFLIQSPGGSKLLYATDTAYIQYPFLSLTHIAVECNFQKEILEENVDNGWIHPSLKARVNKNHFSLDRVLALLESTDLSKVEKIYLLHISSGNANPAEMKKAVQALTGKQVVIP